MAKNYIAFQNWVLEQIEKAKYAAKSIFYDIISGGISTGGTSCKYTFDGKNQALTFTGSGSSTTSDGSGYGYIYIGPFMPGSFILSGYSKLKISVSFTGASAYLTITTTKTGSKGGNGIIASYDITPSTKEISIPISDLTEREYYICGRANTPAGGTTATFSLKLSGFEVS